MQTGDMIVGHMIGDYALQNDWQAQNKTEKGDKGLAACAVHAALYTGSMLCVSMLTGKRLSWKALAFMGGTHFLIDRHRLAAKAMEKTGQKAFRDNRELFGVWPAIVVDNTYHLALNLIAIKMLDDEQTKE